MLPLGKYDVSKLSPPAQQFCQNHKVIEVGIYTPSEMEKVARKLVLGKWLE